MFDGLTEIGKSYGMKMNVEKTKIEMGRGEKRSIQGFGGET
jgi:hypothetical protein